MVVGAILITHPSFIFGVDDNDFVNQYPNINYGHGYALLGSVVMSFAMLLVAMYEDTPWSLWISTLVPVGAGVAPFMLWAVNRLQFPIAEGVKESAIFYALGLLVGVLNLLAQLLIVLAVQVPISVDCIYFRLRDSPWNLFVCSCDRRFNHKS